MNLNAVFVLTIRKRPTTATSGSCTYDGGTRGWGTAHPLVSVGSGCCVRRKAALFVPGGARRGKCHPVIVGIRCRGVDAFPHPTLTRCTITYTRRYTHTHILLSGVYISV